MNNFISINAFPLGNAAENFLKDIPHGWEVKVNQDNNKVVALPSDGSNKLKRLGKLSDHGLSFEWVEAPMSAEECYAHGVAIAEWHIR